MADKKSVALVAEDTDLGCWALTRALEGEGYQVHAAPTWTEAADWLGRIGFSLVLAAVSSPSDALGIVADVSRCAPRAHLVLLADEDSVAELRLACGPGPDILVKPFDLERLTQVAVSHLEPGGETLTA